MMTFDRSLCWKGSGMRSQKEEKVILSLVYKQNQLPKVWKNQLIPFLLWEKNCRCGVPFVCVHHLRFCGLFLCTKLAAVSFRSCQPPSGICSFSKNKKICRSRLESLRLQSLCFGLFGRLSYDAFLFFARVCVFARVVSFRFVQQAVKYGGLVT